MMIPWKASLSPPGVRLAFCGLFVGLATVFVVLATGGCSDSPRIRSSDIEAFHELVDTGLHHESDPYVRAETLHLFERAGTDSFAEHAHALLQSDSSGDPRPMVRVAAVRLLLASEHSKAESLAKHAFNEGSASEKEAVLAAILEHGSKSLQTDLMWRSLHPSQPNSLRRFAVERALRPRVLRAAESESDPFTENRFVPKAREYLRRLEADVGGPVARLLMEIGERGPIRDVVGELQSDSNDLDERLRAARILIESRTKLAEPVYLGILERSNLDFDRPEDSEDEKPEADQKAPEESKDSKDEPDDESESSDDELKIPEKQIDPELVRSAVLGLAALGDTEIVPHAKNYLKKASSGAYNEVLEALANNPAGGARLALQNALADARPEVRLRAIELYGERDDASMSDYLDLVSKLDLSEADDPTRFAIAGVLERQFGEQFHDRLAERLSERKRTAEMLRLARAAHAETGHTEIVDALRGPLRKIAENEPPEIAELAGYLLAQLPDLLDDRETFELVKSLDSPAARYALLERINQDDPEGHTEFLLDNFYSKEDAPETFSVRLRAGLGLWLASNKKTAAPAGDERGEGDG